MPRAKMRDSTHCITTSAAPPPTRRLALAALASAAALAPIAALAGTGAGTIQPTRPDAELLRLGELLDAARQRENAAWAEVDRVDAEDDTPEWMRAEELSEQAGAIADLIDAQRATTLDGVLVKMRAVGCCRGNASWAAEDAERIAEPGERTDAERILAGLLRDLASIGGQA